jgi:sulfoxide reductase heme-binding subunit YedZ
MAFDLAAGNYGPIPVHGVLYWSGVWATVLLLLVLAVTPVRTIFRWNRLIAVRRALGIAALAYTLFHVLAYFELDSWDFLKVASEMAVMSPNVIAATVSTVALAALGATSFDAAVRRMGPRWQKLHRLVYPLTVLAIVHFLLSRGMFQVSYFFAGALFWLLAWRLLERYGRGTDPRALLLLAVVSAAFTLLLEAGWMQAHHGVEAMMPFMDNFTLPYGPTPAWQVLYLGVLAAIAAALARTWRGESRHAAA